jgi:hypothetical protein
MFYFRGSRAGRPGDLSRSNTCAIRPYIRFPFLSFSRTFLLLFTLLSSFFSSQSTAKKTIPAVHTIVYIYIYIRARVCVFIHTHGPRFIHEGIRDFLLYLRGCSHGMRSTKANKKYQNNHLSKYQIVFTNVITVCQKTLSLEMADYFLPLDKSTYSTHPKIKPCKKLIASVS